MTNVNVATSPPIFDLLRSHWLRITLTSMLFAGAAAALSMLRPRRYQASVTLSTMASSRPGGLGQGLSAALLASTGSGLQPSPVLISKLFTTTFVLQEVALTRVTDSSSLAMALALDPDLTVASPDFKLVKAVGKALSVSLDRETGLVTVSVAHRDSALARQVVQTSVAAVTRAFRSASQTQARQTRVAQEIRVRELRTRLDAAERAVVAFAAENRQVRPQSALAIEQDRRQRDVTQYQTLLTQALTEQETARTKEIEETAAVVVLDPIPRSLPPVSRGTIGMTAIAGLIGLVLSMGWVMFVVRRRRPQVR
jgi:uncharacterized protein involved in exopolysaccharide biosynthesis